MTAKDLYHNRAQADLFGRAMDQIREEVVRSLGERDAAYLDRLLFWHRCLEIGGRLVLFASLAFHPEWGHSLAGWGSMLSGLALGTVLLSLAKILDNMEIGHNIMHAQWDWLGRPDLHSSTWEWDAACPSEQWRHSHNVIHHTWTNVVGKDRDVGYGLMRMSPIQPWRPLYLMQPFFNVVLALTFEFGVALHDLELDLVINGQKSWRSIRPAWRVQLAKVRRQVLKDWVLFPLLAGPFFGYILAANVLSNVIRNVWAYAIIFCGHFPADVHMFDPKEIEDESRGQWYVRQVLGSCNIRGGRWFHILSGNLSHQIEHHLFPDLPSNRYQEVAPRVRQIAQEMGIPYNQNSFFYQFGTTWLRILRYAWPSVSREPSTPSTKRSWRAAS